MDKEIQQSLPVAGLPVFLGETSRGLYNEVCREHSECEANQDVSNRLHGKLIMGSVMQFHCSTNGNLFRLKLSGGKDGPLNCEVSLRFFSDRIRLLSDLRKLSSSPQNRLRDWTVHRILFFMHFASIVVSPYRSDIVTRLFRIRKQSPHSRDEFA